MQPWGSCTTDTREWRVSRRRRRPPRQAQVAAPATDLEPPIRKLEALPSEIVLLRAESKRRNDELAKVLTPRIEGHLLTFRTIIDELIAAHQRIADTMEFGIDGHTRWTAVWEMSGRCLGLCNALLVQLREGFASEVVPTLRSIHEAAQLVTVLAGPGEQTLLRTWLENRTYLSAQRVRAAEARIEQPAVELLKKQGIRLAGDQQDLGQQVYGILSKPAHNMRIGFAESVTRPLRQFSYGPHPYPVQRAVHVEFGGQAIEDVALRVGRALAIRFLGRDFYNETVKPLLASLHAIRDEMPIDPPTVRRLARDE
jgi:hypothetical protein